MQGRTYGPTPSRHDHVGQMRFDDRLAVCEGCGQEWLLDVTFDAQGRKLAKWRPV